MILYVPMTTCGFVIASTRNREFASRCNSVCTTTRPDGLRSCGHHRTCSSDYAPFETIVSQDFACSICHISEGMYSKLQCGHWFHTMCGMRWKGFNNNTLSCPICRSVSIDFVTRNIPYMMHAVRSESDSESDQMESFTLPVKRVTGVHITYRVTSRNRCPRPPSRTW